MNIDAINGEWFYDDVTPRGVSFDGLLPQACKIPLGNMQDFELIHTPEKMSEFQNNVWYQKNWSLADTLMTFSPLQSENSGLVEAYRKETNKILSYPCDSESCQHDVSSDAWPTRGSCRGLRVLEKDLSLYGDMIMDNNELDEGKFYDVKKEIYRLPDRMIAALAKCCKIKSSGIFALLDELCEKEVISSEARDNLASASAIAIRLRLSTYLKAGKQGELLSSNSNDETEEKAPVYHMPSDEELFHFFFIAIPLYDELRHFKTCENVPSSFANHPFFNDSVITMGHIYCRLLKYDKAIECYERAVRENPGNLSNKIRQIRLALFATHSTQGSDKIRENLDDLLGKMVKNFSQLDTNVDKTTLEFTPHINSIDMEVCRQLIEGLLFADEIYGSPKYFVVAEKILHSFQIPFTSYKSDQKHVDLVLLVLKKCSNDFFPKDKIDIVVFLSTSFIEEEGISTRSIALLNSLGEFLFGQTKLDKAYRCFQMALRMERQLYGTRPNVKMMTSLRFLSMIARDLKMNEESKFYCESLVQLCESFGGIKSKLLLKETYLKLLYLSYTADEALRYAENGLKVTTGSKNDRELLLNCFLYCESAHALHRHQNPEQAWKAVLDAQACLRNSTSIKTRESMIVLVLTCWCAIEKPMEGIELLEKELQMLTLKSQAEEKAFCLKAFGKLCLVQGLAPEAKKYYSQAIDIQQENDEHVFHDLECRIGILKAAVMEDSVPSEKPVLDEALSSAMKLSTSKKKCSFLKKIGKLCHSIGEIGNVRLCCLEALRSATELPASNEKCFFLQTTGELCESISEIALARQCYNEALNTYQEESSIAKKLPLDEFILEMKLGELAKEMIGVDSVQRIHYDRATVIVQQHVATGHVDSDTVLMFLFLAEEYRSIDPNEEIRLLLESLKVSEIVCGEDKSQEMVTTSLQELSRAYYLSGDMQNSMKYRERQIKMELELYSENPFIKRILNTLMKWAFTSFDVSSSNDSIERVSDFFLSSLNDKAFLLSTTAAKTIAAKCFTFVAVLFYTSSDFEKAKSLNEKACQLFGEFQESVETERDPCRETCDLMKTILSSEKILPSHRTELYIYLFNIGGPYPDSDLSQEEKFMPNYEHAGYEERIEEINEQARSTLVEERKTLSQLTIVQSQSEALEYQKSKDFRRAAEIHASLQPQQLSFYAKSPVDGEEKFISEAIKAKNKNEPSEAIRFLDLALELQLPEGQCRKTTKILKIRGECFLSMGHFRSAAIDFTKADALHSIETIDNRENLYEYSEVLIGLIKSEILCNNVEAAWLVCERGIKLVSDHGLKETINQQALKLFYLGVKCVKILLIQLERGKDKEIKLVQAHYLFQKVLSLCDLMEEVGASETELFTTKFEVLTLFNIFPTLRQINENENIYQKVMNNVSADVMSDSKLERLINWGMHCLLRGRLLIMSGDIEQSINWLHKSLVAFFSTAPPDFVSFYEEFLPLLQAITAAKSGTPDQSRSPFQQAVDMCKRTLTNQEKSLNYVYQFLKTLIIIYRSLGQAQEAMAVAEIALGITDVMCDDSDSDRLNSRCKMLLHLAQIHQQNSSNPAFDADKELNLAEHYYLSNRGRDKNMMLCKDLSYANFLCERRRFAEAVDVLEDMRNLGELLWKKYVYAEYFSCVFYGAGVEKSVKINGELFATVGDVLCNLMVRAYVGIEKKKEAVAMCETLTDVNLLDVHEQLYGKRPSCKPYLVKDCHRELFSLLNEEDQNQFENCDFPLSSANLTKLYYMLGEYEMALKYLDVESSEMLDMKVSCLRLAGNELVDSNRGNESLSFFVQFLAILQDKEGFLDSPFHNQCEILQTYSFANQYYAFRSLGLTHAETENIDAAIQCYERCIELDEDFTWGQDIAVTLSELYQTKALTVDLGKEDLRTVYMDLAWKQFQKLFQKTAELTTFVERSFASLLTRLARYEEAVNHFYKVIGKADYQSCIGFGNVDKPLVDVYLRREIEALDGNVDMPIIVLAVYELILTLMKLNEIRKAQKVAFFLEGVVEKYSPAFHVNDLITLSMAGYAYKIVGNKEKAKEIFVSVLEKNPGNLPVTEALGSLCM